jgi:uncharacterized protein (TIRG00374 family)
MLFLLAVMFQLILLFLKALRWIYLNEYSFRWKDIPQRFGEFFESYAIGVITPGRLGELMKAGHAKSRQGALDTALRVLVERGFDVGLFIIFAGLAMAIPVVPEMPVLWGWLVVAAGTLIITLAFIILLSPTALKLMEELFKTIRLLKRESSLQQRMRDTQNVITLAGLSILSNLSYFVSCYLLALGVGIDLSFLWVTGGVAFAGLLNMIPVTVMGLGTREVTFLYVFASFPDPQVLAFSGLVFLVAQVGGGLVSLVLGQAFLWRAKRI